jgi:hypothetical protein
MKYRLYIPGTALLISSILAAPSSAMTARQLSIVPGADIVGNIAVREANASPIVKKRKAAQEMEGIQPRQSFEARRARFEAATGLTEDDVVAVSFSCDMDTANMKGLTQRDRMGALNGLVAVQLAKSISMKNIKQAVKLEYGSEDLAGVSDVNIGGQASLKVNASKPDDPDVYLTLTPDGRVLMAAFSADSLAAALGRCASGASLKEPANLARVRSILAPETQIQMACIVPPSVRAAIDEQLGAMRQQAAQNPGMAAMIGFSQLFSGIQNLCVGVQLDDDALISVAGSLGNVQAAQQASILLETMIIPMIQASMMKQSAGSQPADLENMVSVRTKDTALQVRLRLTEEQMMQKFMQAPAAPAAPATP